MMSTNATPLLGLGLYIDERGQIFDLADAYYQHSTPNQELHAFIAEYMSAHKGLQRLGPLERPRMQAAQSIDRPTVQEWNEILSSYKQMLKDKGTPKDYAALFLPRRTFEAIEVKKVPGRKFGNLPTPDQSFDVVWDRMFEVDIPLTYGASKKKGVTMYQFIPADIMHAVADGSLLDAVGVFAQQVRHDHGDDMGDLADKLYADLSRVAAENVFGTGMPVAIINRLHAIRMIAYLVRDPSLQTEESMKILKKIGNKVNKDTGFLEPEWHKAENRQELSEMFSRYFPIHKSKEKPIADLFLYHDAYAWMSKGKEHEVDLMRFIYESEAGPLHNPKGNSRVSKGAVVVDVIDNVYRLLDYLDKYTPEQVGAMLDTLYDGSPEVHPLCANLLSFAKPKKEVKTVSEFNEDKCRIIFVPSYFSILPGQVFFAQVDHLVKGALGAHPLDVEGNKDPLRNLAGFSPFYGNLRDLFIKAALRCNEAFAKKKKAGRVLRFAYSDNLYVCWYDERGFHWVSLDGKKMEGQATLPKYHEMMRFLMKALGHNDKKSTFTRGWQNYLTVLLPRISVEAFAMLGTTLINTNWLGSGAPGTSTVNTSQWAFFDYALKLAMQISKTPEDELLMRGFSLGEPQEVGPEVTRYDATIREFSWMDEALRAAQLSIKVESYIIWSPADSNPGAPPLLPLDLLGFDASSMEIYEPRVGLTALSAELNRERLYKMVVFAARTVTRTAKKKREFTESVTAFATVVRIISLRLAYFLGGANDPVFSLFIRWRLSRLVAGVGSAKTSAVKMTEVAKLLDVQPKSVEGILRQLTEKASTIPSYDQFLEFNAVDIDLYDADQQQDLLDVGLRVFPTNPIKIEIEDDIAILSGGGARQAKVKTKPGDTPNKMSEHVVTVFPYAATRLTDVRRKVSWRDPPDEEQEHDIYEMLRAISPEFSANEPDGVAVLKVVPPSQPKTRLVRTPNQKDDDILVTYIDGAVPARIRDTPWWRTILYYAKELRQEIRNKILAARKFAQWDDIEELNLLPERVIAFFIYHKPGFLVYTGSSFDENGLLRDAAVDLSTIERRRQAAEKERRKAGVERREYTGAAAAQSRGNEPRSSAARDAANRERRDRARNEARERKAARDAANYGFD